MNNNLTAGKPEKVLWKFCIPLFGSIVFQQLYNIADSLVVGKFVGENALAAVGNSYEITLIFIAFAFGCNIGCSVVVAQLFGAGRYREMKTAVYTTWISCAALCAVLMGLGILLCRNLLLLINTPPEILADSKLYLDIYIWGLPFLFFYNIATGIFSALGDSKTPFLFLAVSSVSNILVDIWFVQGFHMGVGGVAWATFLCQGLSCVLALYAVYKRLAGIRGEETPENLSGETIFSKETVFSKETIFSKETTFSFGILKKIIVIAVPSILQQSFISIGNIILQSVINSFGPGVIAGYAASVKLNNLVITSFTTLGNGVSSYTAQNIGANIMPRIREGFRAGVKIVWILCVPIVLLYLTFGGVLVRCFMSEPSDMALNTGIQFLRILSPFYFVVSVKLVADGVLRGAGLMRQFMAATFTDLILRVALAVGLAQVLGVVGIWSAWPVGWVIGMAMSVWFYRNGPWKTARQQP